MRRRFARVSLLILRSTDWKESYTFHVSRRQMSFYFGGKAYGHPCLVKQTKRKAENVPVYVLFKASIKLRLIVMHVYKFGI